MHRGSTVAIALVLLLTGAAAVSAESVSLYGGQKAKFKDNADNAKDLALIKFKDWQIVLDASSPPTTAPTAFRLITKPTGGDRVDSGEVVLDSSLWAAAGTGYKYKDKAGSKGGAIMALFKPGMLKLKLKGVNYDPAVVGPLEYAQLTFKVGDKEYCGRFTLPVRNEPAQTILQGPTSPCPVECPAGFTCEGFNIVPGFSRLDPANCGGDPTCTGDDGHTTWLRVWDFNLNQPSGGTPLFSNATDGVFVPSLLELAKSNTVGPDGKAELRLMQPVVMTGANYVGAAFLLIAPGYPGKICVKISQSEPGWIDCNGGSNADVTHSIDSQGADLAAAGVLTLSDGGADSGAGAAVLPVNVQFVGVDVPPGSPGYPEDTSWDKPCSEVDYSAAVNIVTAFGTGSVTSTVLNGWGSNLGDPNIKEAKGTLSVTLPGKPFDCANWGASPAPNPAIAVPLYAMDYLPPVLGASGFAEDVALTLRFELVGPGTCSDGVLNGTESDVDCGGSCPICADGKLCRSDADCAPSTYNCGDGNRCGMPPVVE